MEKKAILTPLDYLHGMESARIVQQGLLPKKRHLKKVIPDSFVIYEPKDIVSGDFFWVGNSNQLDYVVVGDCTGHGVSAALLTVLGLNLFEYVIMNKGIKRVDKILQEVDKKFIESFRGELDIYENPWMDVSIVAIDREKSIVYYASANRKMLHIKRNGECQLIDGSKYPIGGWQIEEKRKFNATLLPYQTGDLLYLGSDGMQDQFGGPANKKLKSKNLHDLLHTHNHLSLQQQRKRILDHHLNWKGTNDQTDDICLVGVRL